MYLLSTTLLDDIRAAWNDGVSMDAVLVRFVIETGARAAGCWRLDAGHLQLIGFGGASDMPAEVREGFQEATRRVSLDQTALGIVRAVVSDQPTIARRVPGTSGLERSASWNVKFQAISSLAVPIRDQKRGVTLGVIAVSTASDITENDWLWKTMFRVSEQLGQ